MRENDTASPLPAQAGGATAPTGTHPAIRRRGVLVVDNDKAQRQSTIDSLRKLGVNKIFEAGDGESALRILRGVFQPPAVIFLDLDGLAADGREFVRHLAQEGGQPNIVAASASPDGNLDAVLAELGLPLLKVLGKPFGHTAVAEALARFGNAEQPAGQSRDDSPDSGAEALRRCIVPGYRPRIALDSGHFAGLECLAGQAAGERAALATLDAVLRDLAVWHEAGFYPTIAINVPAPSLADRVFLNGIVGRVEAARISASALILEVAESPLAGDFASAFGPLELLRHKGFGLSVGDGGSGFSSLRRIARLPFTELKISRAFVHDANAKWQLRAGLEAALRAGTRLGLATVADGIKTREELGLLRSLGCSYGQGDLISPPLPATAVQLSIRSEQKRWYAICG